MTLSAYPKREINPFEALVDEGMRAVSRSSLGDVVNQYTGELMLSAAHMVISRPVDKKEFIKLFRIAIPTLYKLSDVSIKPYLYLVEGMPINSDWSCFVLVDCMKATGYSKPTIYKGLAELCKHNLIARTTTPLKYWMNPNIAFNGSRLKLIR